MSETCPKCGAPRIEFVSSGPDRQAWTRFACCTTVWADGSVSATRTCAMRQLAAITAERDALKAKLDAAARLAESTRESVGLLWRPIETAPKDGTKVLVMSDGIEIVSWNECLETWWDGEWSHGPTHWMPLPEPPADMNDARDGGE